MIEAGQVSMEPETARKHYLDYRKLGMERRTAEDEEIQKSYYHLSQGRPIINANKALQIAGLNESGMPRLAFCRADYRFCHVYSYGGYEGANYAETTVTFSGEWSNQHTTGGTYSRKLETSIVDLDGLPGFRGRNPVPSIPPAHRPDGNLNRYWLCWEVESWDEITGDPLLLKRINPSTFAVLAAWDLTPVEQLVLAGRLPEA